MLRRYLSAAPCGHRLRCLYQNSGGGYSIASYILSFLRKKRLGEKGGAFFNGKEGRDDFRKYNNTISMNKEDRNSFRKEIIGKLEEQWAKSNSTEDDLFYYHPSEDKIVLSHALFWVMTQNIKGKVGKEKYLLLLRQYQEEMLEAYLTESEDFKDLLHYCNIMYNALPMLLRSTYDFHIHLDARKLAAITIVAGGYGGDMPEDQAYDLLDDIDFYYNKVKCRKIEKLLPVLNKLVIEEQKSLAL